MKTLKLIALFCALILLYSFTIIEASSLLNSPPSTQKKKIFEKNVWGIIDCKDSVNYPLFYPHNEFEIHGLYDNSPTYFEEQFLSHKDDLKENLWNMIYSHFLTGELTIYCPFDPDWVVNLDKGLLQYPITYEKYGSGRDFSYFTDKVFREFVKNMQFFGVTDYNSPLIPIMSTVYYEDSIDADGNVVYYPREYFHYTDKDITKYLIREVWEVNEKNELLSKRIGAIAPVVNEIDYQSGNVIGDKTLFWIEFDQLYPLLENYYILDKKRGDKKIYSVQDYFDDRRFTYTITEEDSLHVKLKQ